MAPLHCTVCNTIHFQHIVVLCLCLMVKCVCSLVRVCVAFCFVFILSIMVRSTIEVHASTAVCMQT